MAIAPTLIGISTVPPQVVVDMLPAGVMQHTFDITIQAPGAVTFSSPAQMTFPNVFNAAPGTQLDVLAFDHTTGRLVISGTATVSPDGLTVVTDPGSGITAPGWHGLTPPGSPPLTPPPPCPAAPPVSPPQYGPPAPTPHVLPLLSGDTPRPDDLDAYSVSAPADGYVRTVTVTVDSQLQQVLKDLGLDVGFTDVPITGGTYSLTSSSQPVSFDWAGISDADLQKAGLLKNFAIYGGVVTVDVTTQMNTMGMPNGQCPPPSTPPTETVDQFYIYRYLNPVFATQNMWQSYFNSGVVLESPQSPPVVAADDLPFPDAVQSGLALGAAGPQLPGASTQTQTLEMHVSGQAAVMPSILDPDAFSGSTTINFNPPSVGAFDDTLELRSGVDLDLVGTGTPRQTIYVNEPALSTALTNILNHTGPAAAIAYNLTVPEQTALAPANLQGTINTIFNQVQTYYQNAVGAAVEVEPGAGNDGTQANYSTLQANAGSGGNAGQPYGSGRDDMYAIQQIVANATTLGPTVVDYLLPDAINPNRAGTFSVFLLNCMVDYTNGNGFAAFTDFTATTIAHEAGHTLGLVHVQGIQPGPTTTTVTSANATSNMVTVVSAAGMHVGDTLFFATSNTKATIVSGVGTTLTLSNPIKTTNGETVSIGVYNIVAPAAGGVADIMAYNYGSSPAQASNAFVTSLNALKLASDMTVTDAEVQDALTYYMHSVDTGGAGASVNNMSDDPDDVSVPIPGKSLLATDATTGNLVNGIDFGNQTIVGASVTKNFFLTNLGTEDAVTITGATLTGSSDFNLTLPTGFAGQLAPGASVSFSVRYKAELGPSDGTLTINSDAGPINISLTGSGTENGPAADVDDTNDNLGGAIIGATVTRANAAVINNYGSAPLTITGVRFAYGGTSFSVNGLPANLATNPITIAPGGSYPLSVSYTASTQGLQRGQILLSTNDPANPTLKVGVVGTGVFSDSVGNWGNDYVAISFPQLGGEVLRVVSDPMGNFSAFMPASTAYQIAVYDPISGLIAHGQGVTGVSGQSTDITSTLTFRPSTATDTNGDGIPDDIKFAIGFSPTKSDTSGTGIDDFTKLQDRLPLFGNESPVTGVVAGLALQGEASAVTLQGSPNTSQGQTAYIATGSYGLAIVDATNFEKPTLLGQLSLAGNSTDVAVDPALNVAAVASNAGGLNFVDITNPNKPALIKSVGVDASAVRIVDGEAYAAVGTAILGYDALSGTLLDKLDLGGGTITSLAQDGDFLYALDSANTLHVIDISGPAMVARGSVTVGSGATLASGSGALFVGNGLAYVGVTQYDSVNPLSGYTTLASGYTTVDVSNPDSPTALGDLPTTAAGGQAVAVNGSGIALTAGTQSSGPTISVFDSASTPGQFVTAFSLPVAPVSVAGGEGLGFVADGTGGLQVVNYLAFDTKGIPPTVSISSPVGTEAAEGSTLALTANISDDVQVRNVELLVNGQVVSNDVSFPYNLAVQLPTIAQSGSSTVTIQVQATDTGGNVGVSNTLTIQLVHDTIPPVLIASNVANGGVVGDQFHTLSLQFSKPMDEATFSAATVSLLGPGGTTVLPEAFQFRFDDRYVQITFPQLGLGVYQLVLDASAITGRAGTPLGTSPIMRSFTVKQFSAVFINPSGGDWNDPTNWDTGVVPGPTDDVLISVPGNAAVTISTGTQQVNSLLCENPFSITGGSLQVADTIQVDNTFTLAGGTLMGALILPGTGGQGLTVADNSYYSAPTLDDVTSDANITVAAYESYYGGLNVVDGLTLNGTFTMQSGTLTFSGNQTLAGAATLTPTTLSVPSGSSLTIASGITIQGGAISGDTIINQGVIETNNAAMTLAMSTFTNQGSLNVTNGSLAITGLTGSPGNLTFTGGSLSIDGTNYVIGTSLSIGVGQTLTLTGTWSTAAGVTIADNRGTLGLGTPGDSTKVWSAGAVTVTSGTLNLGGSAASLAGLSVTSSTLNIVGTYTATQLQSLLVGNTVGIGIGGVLDNTGNTLTLVGPLNLAGGTLKGGTVAGSGTNAVVVNASSTLDGVTLNAALNMTQVSYLTLTVLDGLTLNGIASIGGANAYDTTLDFHGSQTLAGTGSIVFGGSYTNLYVENGYTSGAVTFTVGAGITIHGGSATIENNYAYSYYNNLLTIINQGVIASDAGGTINVDTGTFTNQGSLNVSAGSTLNVTGLAGNVGNVSIQGAGVTMSLSGAFTLSNDLAIGAGQTLVLGGAWNNAANLTVNGGTLTVNGTWTNDALPLNGVNVNVYTGYYDGVGGGAPYTNLAGSFTANDISFGASQNNFAWQPFGLTSFGADFTANINVAAAGSYAFPLSSDDGAQLYIDGNLVTDDGGQHYPGVVSGSATLTAGQHTLEVQFDADGNSESGVDLVLPAGVSYVGQTYTHAGTITATNSTLNLGGASDSDAVSATGAAINIAGDYTTAQIAGLFGNGNILAVTTGGTLDNTGNTLNLNAITGSLTLNGGTLKGGIVTAAPNSGAKLIAIGSPTLDGVTFNSDLDLTAGVTLTVMDGLTLNGAALLTGQNASTLNFSGTQTLGGTGSIDFGTAANTMPISAGATLTIGSGITIHGANAVIGGSSYYYGNYPAGALVNLGAIAADAAAGTINIDAISFQNLGTIKAASGGSLEVAGLATNPVATYSGNGTAADAANGNNATLVGGATYAPGQTGQAFSLDGVTGYVITPNLAGSFPSGDTSVTIGLWFNAAAPGVIMTELGGPSINNPSWHDSQLEILSDGTVEARVWDLPAVSLGVASFNAWHYVVLRYNQGTQTLDGFLDNLPSATTVTGNRQFPDTNQVYYAFGATDSTNLGSGAYLQGLIQDISIYNRPLSAAEVGTLYTGGTVSDNLGNVQITGANSSLTLSGNHYVVNSSFALTNGESLTLNGTWSTAPGVTLSANNATLGLGSAGSPSQTWNAGSVTATDATVNLGGSTDALPLSATGSTINVVGAYTGQQISGLLAGNTVSIGTGGVLDNAGDAGVSYWQGNGNTNDSISANNGTLVGGASYTSGVSGQAFSFAGSGQAVVIGNPPDLQLQNFTIECWVQRASTTATSSDPGTAGGLIFGYGQGGYTFGLDPDGQLVLSQVGYSEVRSGTVAVNDTNWHQVAVTENNGTVTFYVDGVASALFSYGPSYFFNTDAAIGERADTSAQSFLGNIENLAVCNQALSAAEIQRLAGGGQLATAAVLALNANTGSLYLNGGTVQGGIIAASGGAKLIADQNTTSTLDGVTLDSNLDQTASSASVTVLDGLTLNGTASVGGSSSGSSSLNFSGNQTLAGTGSVDFGTGSNSLTASYSSTLTIGPGITLHGSNATIGGTYSSYPATIINEGAINADTAGGTISIDATSFTNQGSIAAENGGSLAISGLTGDLGVATLTGAGSTLSVNGSGYTVGSSLSVSNGQTLSLLGGWTAGPGATITANNATLNLGTSGSATAWTGGAITAANSTINLGGSTTTLNLTATGCTINIVGTYTSAEVQALMAGNTVTIASGGVLDNSNATLALTAATGSLTINGGTLKNGIVTAAGGAKVIVNGGTLDGTTVNCELDLSGSVTIVDGLTINANAVVNGATLTFSNTETLGGTGTMLFSNYTYVYLSYQNTLTIDSGVTLSGSASFYGEYYYYYYDYGTIINKGTITADDSQFYFDVGTFTNAGALIAKNAGSISIATTAASNTGSLQVQSGASMSITGFTGDLGSVDLAGSGSSLSITGTNYTVDSAMSVNTGETLSLLGSWTANGVITANSAALNLGTAGATATAWSSASPIVVTDSTLNVGGTTTALTVLANGSTITVTGGYTTTQLLILFPGNTVLIGAGAVIDNTGTTLALTATTGALIMNGGEIKGGAVSATGGAEIVATGSVTFDGVTLNTKVDLTGGSATILDGLTLNGAIQIGDGDLDFNGNQTLATTTTGTIALSSTYVSISGTLTIGANITMSGSDATFASGGIVNLGTIAADAPGSGIAVNTTSFSNQGSLQATDGGSLSVTGLTGNLGRVTFSGTNSVLSVSGTNYVVDSSFSISGGESLTFAGTWSTAADVTIIASGATLGLGTAGDATKSWTAAGVTATNSTVNLGGATASLTGVAITGSTINIVGGYTAAQIAGYFANNAVTLTTQGSLDNTGNTLTQSPTSSPVIAGGTIKGGTITETGGAVLTPTGNLTLDGVTINGNVNFTGITVTVLDGLTLNGVAQVNNTALSFSNTQTLGGTGSLVFGAGSNYLEPYYGTTLTIGSGITLHGSNLYAYYDEGAIINEGTIADDTAGGQFTFSPTSFTNQGSLTASGGGSLSITGLTGTLNNVTLSGAGSAFSITGTNYTVASSLAASNGETLALLGSWTTAAGVTLSANDATLSLGDTGDNTAWTAGAIAVTNGGTLNLGGQAASLAALSLTSSTLDVVSSYTTAQLQPFLAGNQLAIGTSGVLDNRGNTITLNAATGSLRLGGTLKGGTVNASSGAKVVSTGSRATLDGVILNSDLDLTKDSATILDGLTLNGTATLAGTTLTVSGTQTLGGTGAVVFTGGDNGSSQLYIYYNSTFTIGPNITVHGSAGAINGYNDSDEPSVLINQGTILADTAGVTINVNVSSLQNQGTLEASGGGILSVTSVVGNLGNAVITGANSALSVTGTHYSVTSSFVLTSGQALTLDGTWNTAAGVTLSADDATLGLGTAGGSNQTWTAGTVTATNAVVNLGGAPTSLESVAVTDSQLNLAGSFTYSAIQALLPSNSLAIDAGGALDLTGNTITLNAGTGNLTLAGGTLQGGSVNASGGAKVVVTGYGATLDGVTLNANLDLTAANASAYVLDGLTLNGAADIGAANGQSTATLYFSGTQTLSGTGTIQFGTSTNSANNPDYQPNLLFVEDDTTLTIGAGITIHGGNGIVGQGAYGNGGSYGASVINQGTIDADGPASTILVAETTLINQGTIKATNGGTLNIVNLAPNAGTIKAGAGSLVAIQGALTLDAGGAIDIDLGGTAANLIGQITAGGGADLAGTLDLNLVNGFVPVSGESFNVLIVTSESGTFGTVSSPAGTTFTVSYDPTDVTLKDQ